MENKSIIVLFSLLPVILLLSISFEGTDHTQFSWAQSTTNTQSSGNTSSTNNISNVLDTFRAQGQISSLASDTLAGREKSTENIMWILGGDWEFNVANGNLTHFVIDIDMAQVDGTAAHKHAVESITNATGMPLRPVPAFEVDLMTEQPVQKIELQGNTTMFRGKANFTTNENVQWEDVPIHITMMNGNIISLNLDPAKTEDHFYGLPVFGTIQSIVDQNGKELVRK